jgi:tetratricopeptide (TPR) repeat protein
VSGVPAAIGGGEPGVTATAHADDSATHQPAAAASGSNSARAEFDPAANLASARGEIAAVPGSNPAPVFDPRTLPPPAAAPAPPRAAASGTPRAKPESQRAARAEPPAAPAPGSANAPDLGLKPYVPEPSAAASAPPVVVLKDSPPEAKAEAEPEAEPEPAAPDRAQVTQYTESATKALLRGEVNRAVELLREATRIAPDHAIAWRSLGLALERAGNANAALDAYQHYLSLVPTGAQSEMVRERMRALRQL